MTLSAKQTDARACIITLAAAAILAAFLGTPAAGAVPAPNPHARYYSVEDIATPAGVAASCGGLSFLPDGRLVAVFDHGEVYFYEPSSK